MPVPYGSSGAVVERLLRLFFSVLIAGLITMTGAADAQTPQGKIGSAIRLAVLGDSLTAGYGLPASAAFPVRLQQALKDKGVDADILNAGVSGDTITDGLNRLDWSIPEGTQAVIVELGANDMLRGIDPKASRAALEKILGRLKERHIAVLLCGMYAAPNFGPDYQQAFDAIYPALAKAYDVPLYPFFLDGVASDKSLNQADGLHPTAAGVDTIVKKILPAVESFVKKLSPA
ncbi:MAG: arylesterase [Xanthobacteraceae bacterium]|nr:arylesterase [Xanthobacteraceae bacterium]